MKNIFKKETETKPAFYEFSDFIKKPKYKRLVVDRMTKGLLPPTFASFMAKDKGYVVKDGKDIFAVCPCEGAFATIYYSVYALTGKSVLPKFDTISLGMFGGKVLKTEILIIHDPNQKYSYVSTPEEPNAWVDATRAKLIEIDPLWKEAYLLGSRAKAFRARDLLSFERVM